MIKRLARVVTLLALAAGVALAAFPRWAPIPILGLLIASLYPLRMAWRGARDTALRAAVVWAWASVGLALLSQVAALWEPVETGRPASGHLTYLSVLATLAALTSVLNARRPGGGAWAILMSLLVLVFLIPWLEGPSLARKAQGLARLRLDAPWTLFFGFLVVAGVSNFLPTSFGLSAVWLGLGLVAEYLGLTWRTISPVLAARIWSLFPVMLSLALWSALVREGAWQRGRGSLEIAWLWFRDHWGVVWALRTQERFNRSAEASGWPVRLAWDGLVASRGAEGEPLEAPEVAHTTFLALIRRFADAERVKELVAGPARSSCQRPDVE